MIIIAANLMKILHQQALGTFKKDTSVQITVARIFHWNYCANTFSYYVEVILTYAFKDCAPTKSNAGGSY